MEEKDKPGRKPTGRKTFFKTFSVSCYPDEYEKIKDIAFKANKSVSRLFVDAVLKNEK